MTAVFIYKSVPTFFNQLRSRLAKVGRKRITTYQDALDMRVGFSDGQDIYCVPVAIVRGYYNASYAGDAAPQREAQMYMRDVKSILQESKRLN